jgi:hypothetical protein
VYTSLGREAPARQAYLRTLALGQTRQRLLSSDRTAAEPPGRRRGPPGARRGRAAVSDFPAPADALRAARTARGAGRQSGLAH